MFTGKVWTDGSRLLQVSSLASRQPRRALHHAIQSITSEGLAHCPYVATRVGFEPATFRTEHHHWATTSISFMYYIFYRHHRHQRHCKNGRSCKHYRP